MNWKRRRGAAKLPSPEWRGWLGMVFLGAVLVLPGACLFKTRCDESSDCSDGEICVEGACAEDDGTYDSTGSGSSCVDAGESCEAASCCDSLCVAFQGIGKKCADYCSHGSECVSGCCQATDGGTFVCSSSIFCD